jgi:hypothetical protein
LQQVVVFVIFVADIEGRVGEDEVCERLFDPAEKLYTVATNYIIQQFIHFFILALIVKKSKVKM